MPLGMKARIRMLWTIATVGVQSDLHIAPQGELRSLSCCHFGPYGLLSCCHFGSSHRALSCSNFQPTVDLRTDLLLEEIFLQMSQPPVRYPRSPYTSTGGFTYIPEDQKIWCGNLSRGLTSEDMTEWLKYHQYEVPIPLDVVQQGYWWWLKKWLLIPSAPLPSKNLHLSGSSWEDVKLIRGTTHAS